MLSTILHNPLTHVAFAFILCFSALRKFAWPLIRTMIDGHIETIKMDMVNADTALTDAHKHLKKQTKRHGELPSAVDAIMTYAQDRADEEAIEIGKELQDLLASEKQREKQCLHHLEEDAKYKIQSHTIDIAMDAARGKLSSLTEAEQGEILDASFQKFLSKKAV